ncbi:manganese catalase family protein [Bacillus mojavensis]|jgi:Mn-containing catalase|uniref:Manganese catalase n=1 Tax=Bacillus mojavensis TaxID=72360 RepID=A0AAP3CPU5_BACMO|nr:manganese catalase family protein [Bacillus mojavensis]MCY8106699.1 manganese catalase family protein [Bacillus mojavensis]MCY8482163.1 manganese catalase family protein [Bacillus mojavensis]MCY8508370.1 manganese catalase family protein [Bacillus mojavensis]MCY9089280.1 manganese catalase family protein [Bacillus mojavensis]MEC1627743.1 manganese catalase family protein [Bacillus mojavensis]
MFYYKEELINIIKPDKPDPAAAKVLQEILGGHYGEMRTMMQYFFQSSNFRGKQKQYRDLLRGIFLEEIAHVELVQNTINALLDESGGAGVGSQGIDHAPLDEAVKHANPHHYIIGAQSSLPVDAGGNPWNASWVYNHGNLITDLLDNLLLESTGVLQKTRIYEMSSNQTFRETLAFLIVRDNAHQNAFAKALETLGVDWAKLFPVPNYDINKYPECRKYVDLGYHNVQFNFRLDETRIAEIFQGKSPSRNGGELQVTEPPAGFPVPVLPEMPNEHSPGLGDMNA